MNEEARALYDAAAIIFFLALDLLNSEKRDVYYEFDKLFHAHHYVTVEYRKLVTLHRPNLSLP